MTAVTREQFLRLAGVKGDYHTIQPVRIGRGNSIVTKGRDSSFSTHMRNLDYTSSDELRKINPEPFMKKQICYISEDGTPVPMNGYRGIVGRRSRKTYTVVSDRYKLIQHRVMVDAMADAADDCGVRVFGTAKDSCGRFDGFAWFSNPDYHWRWERGTP